LSRSRWCILYYPRVTLFEVSVCHRRFAAVVVVAL
jgi:hypothetical protein